jgi:hypothetical protein
MTLNRYTEHPAEIPEDWADDPGFDARDLGPCGGSAYAYSENEAVVLHSPNVDCRSRVLTAALHTVGPGWGTAETPHVTHVNCMHVARPLRRPNSGSSDHRRASISTNMGEA